MSEALPPPSAHERLVTALATQLHRDRRAFLGASAAFAIANLVVAGIVWAVPGGPLAWAVVVTAFLGSVFFALTVDWELHRVALWRREIARIGPGDPAAATLGGLLADSRIRPGRALKWLNWGITGVWLLSLLALIRGTGIRWTGLL